MFASDEGLHTLSSAMTWYMDGNCAMAPKQFKHVFVVRIVLGQVTVSVAYALLPSKRSSARTTCAWGSKNLKEIADEMPLRTIPLLEYIERVCVGTEGSPARFPLSKFNEDLQTL